MSAHKRKTSKAIVVDASVLRSAGLTENPTSRLCREALQTMLDYCHRAAFSGDVAAEWRTHASRFSVGWLSAMAARKKLVRVDEPVPAENVRDALRASIASPAEWDAVEKDFHLLVTALATDRTVLTQDEKLRHILHAAAHEVIDLRRLVFANPAAAHEAVAEWLNRGAPADKERCLGYRPRRT
jgi:hypothetical protein